MGNVPFSKPVFLKLHRTGNFQARTPWDALEYLEFHWPAAHTAHYRTAMAVCRSALDGEVDSERARRALIDAAQRARVLARGWSVDGEARNTRYVAVPRMPLGFGGAQA